MIEKHGLFQGVYFYHHLGLDRNARDQYRGHEWFDRTAEFCARYDQTSFDPDYQAMPLEAFELMVHRVLAAERLMPQAAA
jgi:predicted HD phosphohydrolase